MAPQIYPVTLLDSNQVIQYVYDETTQALRTTALATIIGGDLTVDIDGVYEPLINPDPDNIGLIAHVRAISPDDSDQTERITSVANLDVHALDVSVHNSDGTAIDSLNPLPVAVAGVILTDPDVNIHDGAGNALTSQVNGAQRALDVGIVVAGVQIDPRQIRALTAADVVTANQGTSPWLTSRDWVLSSGTDSVSASITNFPATVAVTQSTSPWVIAGTVIAAEDKDYGTVGINTLRTASQIGNATGAALFGAGITTAQVLRVVLPTDQTAIPVTQTTASNLNAEVQGDAASGSAKSGNPVQTGAVFNTTQPTVTTGQVVENQATAQGALIVATGVDTFTTKAQLQDNNGTAITLGQKVMASSVPVVIASDQTININVTDSVAATYSALSSFTIAANPTDVFTIYGSASKTVKVRRLVFSATNTGNLNINASLRKRSTANTGGTSTTLTATPFDSNNAAATAVVKSYTANPTLGTQVGDGVRASLIFAPALASTNPGQFIAAQFGEVNTQPIVLRGTSEGLVVSLNGTAITGTTVLIISVEWTEET